jgi:hypothetical protein
MREKELLRTIANALEKASGAPCDCGQAGGIFSRIGRRYWDIKHVCFLGPVRFPEPEPNPRPLVTLVNGACQSPQPQTRPITPNMGASH